MYDLGRVGAATYLINVLVNWSSDNMNSTIKGDHQLREALTNNLTKYHKPIFLTSIFKERIWGGTRLKEFNYKIPSNLTGECWGISAHKNGQSKVKTGEFEGITLSELWRNYPHLFGAEFNNDEFPLLVKILDAHNDLSVQVHPNDEYAFINEQGEKGKTECWYIIDCKDDAEIILGHTAHTIEEFKQLIEEDKWDSLLRRVKIKPGDFFYVPSGTIHAICEGTLILETQQSSDTTYRLYDYDRLDDRGQKRELHIEKAIDVIGIPHEDYVINKEVVKQNGAEITTFLIDDYFSVYKWDITGEASFTQDRPFMLCSVLNGEGNIFINDSCFKIKKGDHFILPYGLGDFVISGKTSLIVSHT